MTGFFEGGAKSMSFGKVRSAEAQAVMGRWRGGPIINVGAPKQQTDWEDRTPKTWPGGDPIMQLPITLDTARGRCPEPAIDAEDDLVRDWYITKGRQDFQALKAALRKAGANDVQVGGELYGRWASGVGEKGDPRVFEFVYTPPVPGSNGFMDEAPAAYDPATGQPLNARAHAVNNEVQQHTMPPQVPPAQQSGPVDPTNGQPLAPPQPVFNQQTGQWEIPAPAPAAPPAAPPPPPQPVWNAATGQWEVPGQPPAGPPNNGYPAQQPTPAGPPPQAGVQPDVTNPYRR